MQLDQMNPDERDAILEKLKPVDSDVIEKRIKHRTFAKTIFWLVIQSKSKDFIYASELAKFLRLSRQRVFYLLTDLCDYHILVKSNKYNMNEYHFVRNSHTPVVEKYFSSAQKVLDIS
jgi:ribosome biogenesis protein Nip4